MSGGAAKLAAAAVAAALATALAAQPAPAALEACRAALAAPRADAPDDVPGAATLGERCPGLGAALAASAWGAAFEPTDVEALPPRSIDALIAVTGQYAEPARERVSTAALDAALAELAEKEAPPPPRSWWDRAMQWLEQRLGRDAGADSQRLREWLGDWAVPERWVRALVIAVGVLVVVLAAGVLLNELRIAGRLGRRAFLARTPIDGAELAPLGASAVRTPQDVQRLPAASQPAALLHLVLDALRRRGSRLRDSLTHRELATAAELPRDVDRESLRAVAGAAERVTYGGWRPRAGETEPLLARGDALLRSLQAEQERAP